MPSKSKGGKTSALSDLGSPKETLVLEETCSTAGSVEKFAPGLIAEDEMA
jgi:hypothetical protein